MTLTAVIWQRCSSGWYVLEVANLRNSTDIIAHQSFPMNCKLSEDEQWLWKNLQRLSPRPAYLIAVKAFLQCSHHGEAWDNSIVNLCGDWNERSVVAPSTVPRAVEITNASKIFICTTTDPLDVTNYKMKHLSAKHEKLLVFQDRRLTCLFMYCMTAALPTLHGNEKCTAQVISKLKGSCFADYFIHSLIKTFFLGQEWLVSLFRKLQVRE